MNDQDLNNDEKMATNFLLTTPRGQTATAALCSSCDYDSFLDSLWKAAEERDEGLVRKLFATEEQPDQRVISRRLNTYLVSQGTVISQDNFQSLFQSTTTTSAPSITLQLRLRGGIDRQNRVGSKFGGGGVSSSQNAERERKERLKRLALESIDLAKDPYLIRNHLGTYECKLCLTLHTNEANYLAHTQGKKHQQGLARRAFLEKKKSERDAAMMPFVQPAAASTKPPPTKKVCIGRPAYQVFKSRDADTNQRCLSFELLFPEIGASIQPRHRFMSAFEQRVDTPPDRRYQYLLIAADPYETVAFKIPNEPIDKNEGRFMTHWDGNDKRFTVTLYFMDPKEEEEEEDLKPAAK